MKQPIPALLSLVMVTAFQQTAAAEPNDQAAQATGSWKIDFFDDFDSFNPANWQDPRVYCKFKRNNYESVHKLKYYAGGHDRPQATPGKACIKSVSKWIRDIEALTADRFTKHTRDPLCTIN